MYDLYHYQLIPMSWQNKNTIINRLVCKQLFVMILSQYFYRIVKPGLPTSTINQFPNKCNSIITDNPDRLASAPLPSHNKFSVIGKCEVFVQTVEYEEMWSWQIISTFGISVWHIFSTFIMDSATNLYIYV